MEQNEYQPFLFRYEDFTIQNDNDEVILNFSSFSVYMELENIQTHMMPILREIVNGGNPIYIRFLRIFESQFGNIFFYDYNLNRQELEEWFEQHPPAPHSIFTVEDYLRMRDDNVLRVFARDAQGNRIVGNDGEYIVGMMDEYPELFYVLESYMKEECWEDYRTTLFDYLSQNM
jgi:hypothetical protein